MSGTQRSRFAIYALSVVCALLVAGIVIDKAAPKPFGNAWIRFEPNGPWVLVEHIHTNPARCAYRDRDGEEHWAWSYYEMVLVEDSR